MPYKDLQRAKEYNRERMRRIRGNTGNTTKARVTHFVQPVQPSEAISVNPNVIPRQQYDNLARNQYGEVIHNVIPFMRQALRQVLHNEQ